MKILYGVQATGNGHITRARCLSSELARQGARVDYLFSGRPADQLFDMAPFGTYQVREGLTFAIDNGRLDYWRTVRNARLQRFWDDVQQLDTRGYDLVITDFEPVTAWAARRQGTPSIGIGHQYAFAYNVPRDSDSLMARAVLHWFAPVRHALGMHWHHFNAPILPPMIRCSMDADSTLQSEQQVLVYLPFDNTASVLKMLRAHPTCQFHVFCGDKAPGQYGNVHVHPFGRDTFQQRLEQCASVITGAGFELTSEALHLGKRILVKPTRGQMEQMSNAHALRLLGLAETMKTLDTDKVGDWLQNGRKARVTYPDVAAALARWILAGDWTCRESLLAELWSDVEGLPEEWTPPSPNDGQGRPFTRSPMPRLRASNQP